MKSLLYITVINRSDQTGGVTASFAMHRRYYLSEPRALVGFAVRRVLSKPLRNLNPDDFQLAESVLKKWVY